MLKIEFKYLSELYICLKVLYIDIKKNFHAKMHEKWKILLNMYWIKKELCILGKYILYVD